MWSRPVSLLVLAVVLASGCSRPSNPSPDPRPKVANGARATSDGVHVAVVELFTSEGCSSCPKADALLGQLVAETRASQRNVLFLSFHVDYWDGLGFPDPWASPSFSARQRAYARMFQQSGVYTPQAVISGTREVVGSDSSALREGIEAALSTPPMVSVSFDLARHDGGAIDVRYTLGGSIAGTVVHAALVERDLVDTPTAGENEGTTIHHQDVVRAFETMQAAQQGAIVVTAPKSVRLDRSSVVVYVQRTSDLAIVGGAMHDTNLP
jgi:hypothetical protein